MTQSNIHSEANWATRVDLAGLYRLAFHYGWTDLTATHISARLPDDPDCYLLNSYDQMFDEITASNLCTVTWDGEMQTPGRILNQAGHIIHSGILQARPDVNFVMHTHTRAGTAVSATPGGLRPLSQHAGFVWGGLSSHPYQLSTAVADEGALMAGDLGPNYAMLLENHGLLVAGRTAAEAFAYHYYLEMACKIQVDILSCTDNPIEITTEAMDMLSDWDATPEIPRGGEQWPALMRLLEKKHPDYMH